MFTIDPTRHKFAKVTGVPIELIDGEGNPREACLRMIASTSQLWHVRITGSRRAPISLVEGGAFYQL